jgi:HK97 gp10 family phage protein
LKTCINVNNEAKLLADFEKGYQTGETRNSLHYEVNKASLEGYVAANTKHSPYLEYGTRYMDAQPFLRPAVEVVTKGASANSAVTKIMNDEMTKAIRAGKKVKTFT